jgi:ABC-type bacteriocin/lantibiotic exporter with double-glycine peptidase domain
MARVLAALLLALAAGCASFGAMPPRVQEDPGWVTVPAQAQAQRARADCGAAALAVVLARYEPGLQAEEVRRLAGDQATAARLRDVARGRGLRAFLFSGTMADLERELAAGRPVLVGVVRGRLAHYQVVAGRNRERDELLLADPARGWRVMSRQDFEAEWQPARSLTLVVAR